MFICGGKKQKVQMRTLPLEPHTFTLKNNTEDILRISYNPEKLIYESQDKEMLIKGNKLRQLHQFNEANLLQQIDDQLIDIEKGKQKRSDKAAEIVKLEAEILQNQIDIGVIKVMLKNDEMLVQNLQKCDIKFAVELQEQYQKLLQEEDDEQGGAGEDSKRLRTQKSQISQNQSFQKRQSVLKEKLNTSGKLSSTQKL